MSSRSFSFVHVADLHLDSPFKGITAKNPAIADPLRSATFRAFDALIDLCIEREVQFLVVAGDIYDGEDRSLRAQLRFHDGLVRLAEKNIADLCGPRQPRPLRQPVFLTLVSGHGPHIRLPHGRIDTFSKGRVDYSSNIRYQPRKEERDGKSGEEIQAPRIRAFPYRPAPLHRRLEYGLMTPMPRASSASCLKWNSTIGRWGTSMKRTCWTTGPRSSTRQHAGRSFREKGKRVPYSDG